ITKPRSRAAGCICKMQATRSRWHEPPRRVREPDELTCHSRQDGPLFGSSSLAANPGDSVAIRFEFAISINSRSLLRVTVSSTLESCSLTRESERILRARAKSLLRNMGGVTPKSERVFKYRCTRATCSSNGDPGHDA